MTAVVEVRSTPLLSRLLKGGWFLFRLGNTSPLEFFPKVTREVRSLLLSDLGNTFLRNPFGSSLWLKSPRLLKHGCASVGNWPPHTL